MSTKCVKTSFNQHHHVHPTSRWCRSMPPPNRVCRNEEAGGSAGSPPVELTSQTTAPRPSGPSADSLPPRRRRTGWRSLKGTASFHVCVHALAVQVMQLWECQTDKMAALPTVETFILTRFAQRRDSVWIKVNLSVESRLVWSDSGTIHTAESVAGLWRRPELEQLNTILLPCNCWLLLGGKPVHTGVYSPYRSLPGLCTFRRCVNDYVRERRSVSQGR